MRTGHRIRITVIVYQGMAKWPSTCRLAGRSRGTIALSRRQFERGARFGTASLMERAIYEPGRAAFLNVSGIKSEMRAGAITERLENGRRKPHASAPALRPKAHVEDL